LSWSLEIFFRLWQSWNLSNFNFLLLYSFRGRWLAPFPLLRNLTKNYFDRFFATKKSLDLSRWEAFNWTLWSKHRYLKKSRLLKFCYVPATSTASSKGILWQPLTVLTRQTSQAVRAIDQSIFLRCLWYQPWNEVIKVLHFYLKKTVFHLMINNY